MFTCAVEGSTNTNCTWSTLEGVGTFGGPGYFYATEPGGAATAPGTYHVIATSQADPTKSASATVTLVTAPVTVSIAPPMAALSAGQTRQFTATVAVTWSRNPARMPGRS